MNEAVADGWLASTNPLTTVVSLPTAIPVMGGSGSVDGAAPGTKGPAQAAVKTKSPAHAAELTSLAQPTVDPLSPERWHWHRLRAPRRHARASLARVAVSQSPR